jgi:hypothetical protein
MCSPLSGICDLLSQRYVFLLSQGYVISSLRDMCSPLSGIRVLLSQGYVFSSQGYVFSSLRNM